MAANFQRRSVWFKSLEQVGGGQVVKLVYDYYYI
jgi:hypothetical protein